MAKYIVLTDENDQELHPETSWAYILGKPNLQLKLAAINAGNNITITYDTNGNPVINASDAGTIDYEELVNRPVINGSVLTGTHKYVEILDDSIDTKDSIGQTLFKIDSNGNIITKTFSTANLKALAFVNSLASTNLTDSNELARLSDLTLAKLTEDSTHRLVTDTEKNTWNSKLGTNDAPGTGLDIEDEYGNIAFRITSTGGILTKTFNSDSIPASKIIGDTTHKFVTDIQITSWDNKSEFNGDYNSLINKPDFKTVATSGSYNDLLDKPTIPSGNSLVSSYDRTYWNAKSEFDGNYTSLTNKPTLATLLSDVNHRTVSDAQMSSWNAKLEASSNSDSGLDIEDENGNIVFRITNDGNIITKDFNSSDIAAEKIATSATYRFVTDNLIEVWNGKQDVISNLEQLIAGAQLGATAIQSDDIGTLAYISKNINLSTDNFTNTDNDIPTTKAIRNFVGSISSGVTSVTVQENVGLELDGTPSTPQISINSAHIIPTATDWASVVANASDALAGVTTLSTSKQNTIDTNHKLSASLITGLASVATSGSYSSLTGTPNLSDMATKTWVGQQSFLTGISQTMITTALGFTPYNATNPNGFITNAALENYATKQFVNSSIATQTANFKGTCTTATTEAQFLTWLNSISNPTLNDYVYWSTTDESSHPVYKRYKYTNTAGTVGWAYEYSLNNSSFTDAQWASINSGITGTSLSNLLDLYGLLEPVASALITISAEKVSSWDAKSNFDGTWSSLTGKPNWIGSSKPSYSAAEITLTGLGTFGNVNEALESFYNSIESIDNDINNLGTASSRAVTTTVTASSTALPTSGAVYTHVSNKLPTFTVSGTTLTIVDNS